jgi:hypothetical protein
MIKTSYDRMFEVIDTLSSIPLPKGKFNNGVMKHSTKFNRIYKKYQEEIFDINLANCQVYTEGEKKGTIMKDEKGSFCYSKEGAQAKEAAVRALREKEDHVSFDPSFIILDIDSARALGIGVIELISGIIVTEENAKSVIEVLENEPAETQAVDESESTFKG